jgi:hypothetical protein
MLLENKTFVTADISRELGGKQENLLRPTTLYTTDYGRLRLVFRCEDREPGKLYQGKRHLLRTLYGNGDHRMIRAKTFKGLKRKVRNRSATSHSKGITNKVS